MRQVNDLDILVAIYNNANRTCDPIDDAHVEDLEEVRKAILEYTNEELHSKLSENDAEHFFTRLLEYSEQVGQIQFIKGLEAGIHIQKAINTL